MADGTKEAIDTCLLLATGYQLTFPYLHSSGALGSDGAPLHKGGIAITVPGFGLVAGVSSAASPPRTLRGVGRDAVLVLPVFRGAERQRLCA